ncbi:MAG: fused MFS/spermidine synthase [Rhodocyclaceae bacterium]|nr:fused MFS/spermidine synthase [Rhodocyclaceae bacterium]
MDIRRKLGGVKITEAMRKHAREMLGLQAGCMMAGNANYNLHMPSIVPKLVFAGTIFASAFSLFLVQPLIAKQILPWFGGTAAVWAICMVFFQVILLAGYAYSDWLSRRLTPRRQVLTHVLLLMASLLFLPIVAKAHWKPTGAEDPTLLILGLLLATIGLPYFLLSTTGPLIQSWVARAQFGTHVYRYFSLSNMASILALISYPFLIETRTALLGQAYGWSVVYALFTILCAASGVYFLRHVHALPSPSQEKMHVPEGDWDPAWRDYLFWLLTAATASWLLLAITNHITQNVAAIPFLWLLPLTLYLLTFVLCFESDRWYRRAFFVPTGAILLAVCAYGLQDSDIGISVKIAVPLYSAGLFFLCMFLHGELARLRPATRHLTRFYLMVSLGGAFGGIVVGLIAPRVLPAYYELGIGFVITAALAAVMFRRNRPVMAIAVALAAACGYFLYAQISSDIKDTRRLERSFYGTLSTLDSVDKELDDQVRQFYHGSIKHGEQYLSPARRGEPTAYYGRSAGIGLAIANTHPVRKKVGMIGLGVGTLAVYGQPGDVYRMYEINPQVIELAMSEFTFMADSRASIETVLGDARLSMEREPPQGFDVLAVDAFSGDSVPVHLITAEALDVYLRHMKADGIVAFHVTNRFLWLPPVIENIARAKGLHVALIHDENDNPLLRNTDWVLVARNPDVLAQEAIRSRSTPIRGIPGLGVWTDDFNNLFDVLK